MARDGYSGRDNRAHGGDRRRAAARPSGNCKVNVAPRTWYDTRWAGVTDPLAIVDPLQFTVASLALQFTVEFASESKYPGTT
jgi:hypothetical protein